MEKDELINKIIGLAEDNISLDIINGIELRKDINFLLADFEIVPKGVASENSSHESAALPLHDVSVPKGTVCDCEDYAEWDSGIKWCSVCGRKLS